MVPDNERVKGLEMRMNTVEEGVSNFRKFQERTARFMDKIEGTEEEREKQQLARHEENARKLDTIVAKTAQKGLLWTIAGVCIAAAGVGVAVVAIMATVWLAKHADMDPSQIFRGRAHEPVLSLVEPQDSSLPGGYVKR